MSPRVRPDCQPAAVVMQCVFSVVVVVFLRRTTRHVVTILYCKKRLYTVGEGEGASMVMLDCFPDVNGGD